MQRALRPILNEMRDGFAPLKRDITNLNETMNQQQETMGSLSSRRLERSTRKITLAAVDAISTLMRND